jgi:hypothetical protein
MRAFSVTRSCSLALLRTVYSFVHAQLRPFRPDDGLSDHQQVPDQGSAATENSARTRYPFPPCREGLHVVPMQSASGFFRRRSSDLQRAGRKVSPLTTRPASHLSGGCPAQGPRDGMGTPEPAYFASSLRTRWRTLRFWQDRTDPDASSRHNTEKSSMTGAVAAAGTRVNTTHHFVSAQSATTAGRPPLETG